MTTIIERFKNRRPFEFLSPLPLEQCVELLAAKSERGTVPVSFLYRPQSQLLITLTPRSLTACEFKMHRDVGKNLNANVVGTLQRQGEGTLVKGESYQDDFIIYFAGFFIVFALMMMLLMGDITMIYFPFLALILFGIFIIRIDHENKRLVDLLRSTLKVSTKH